jgi:hypothetical protein
MDSMCCERVLRWATQGENANTASSTLASRRHASDNHAGACRRAHSSLVRAAGCRSAGPWFKSGCALPSLCSASCHMLARAIEFLRFMEVRQSIGEKRWPYVPHVAAVFLAKQQRDLNCASVLLPATFLMRAWPVLPSVLSPPMASPACSRVV